MSEYVPLLSSLDILASCQVCSASPGREEDPTSHRTVQEGQPLLGGRQVADGAGQR